MPTLSSEHGMKPRLRAAYPQVFVTDIGRAVRFYCDQLGFALQYLFGEPPFYGLISRDGVGLNLRHTDVPVIDPSLRDRETLLCAAIPVDDVEGLFREFSNGKVAFAQTLMRQAWGAVDFIVRDPDGNLLCFASTAEP